ncbi:MAG: hypothetical protein ABJB55_01230 [Actinomycetota bacterium]
MRTVLESDGFDVIGEATATADLARLLLADQPDVVVLDDAIGVTAVQVVGELAPRAKLVVVWPAGVVPIGGAARVDPTEVLTALSATVGLAAGIELSALGAIERPDWIDKVRKDPTTLREMLAARGGVPTRPSVTELQRRGKRLHPSTGMGRRSTARSTGAARIMPAAILPIAASEAAEATTPEQAGVEVTDGELEAARNRRIGMIALGGAAVAGALMIALSFGSHRSPTLIAAEPFLPPVAGALFVPPVPGDTPAPANDGPSGPSGDGAPPTSTDGGGSGSTGTVTTSGSGTTSGTGTSPGQTAPGSGGGSTGSGAGGTGGGIGTPGPLATSPGNSAAHNPHGEPPGQARATDPSTAPHPAHGEHPRHPEHPTHPSPVHTHKR